MSKREQSWSHSLKPGNNDRLGHFPFVQPYEYNPKGNAQSQKNNNCNNNFRTSVPRFCERGCCSSSKGARGAVQGGRGRKRGRCFLKTLDSSRPLLEEGGESHFYTNFRRSVCVCGGGVISEMTTQRTRHMDGNTIFKVTSDLSFFH